MVLHGLAFRPRPDLAARVEATLSDATELGRVAAGVGATRAFVFRHADDVLLLLQFPPDVTLAWARLHEDDRFRALLRLVAPALEDGFDAEDAGAFAKWADAHAVHPLADVYASKGGMVDV